MPTPTNLKGPNRNPNLRIHEHRSPAFVLPEQVIYFGDKLVSCMALVESGPVAPKISAPAAMHSTLLLNSHPKGTIDHLLFLTDQANLIVSEAVRTLSAIGYFFARKFRQPGQHSTSLVKPPPFQLLSF
jgi:hypothetical protein